MVFKKLVKITIISGVFIVAIAFQATAAGNDGKTYTLLAPLPCIPDVSNNIQCKNTNSQVELKTQIPLGDYFQYAFNLLVALASVAAVFMIVWGGFEYVTSASFETKNDGLKKFKNALIGLGMILGCYIVLKAINPKLVQFPKSIPTIGSIVSSNKVTANPSDVRTTQLANQVQKTNLQNDVAQKQAQLDNIIDGPDTQAINDLQNQISQEQDQIANLDKQDALDTAVTQFQDQMAAVQGNQTLTVDQINNLIANVNEKYNIANEKLVNDPRAQELADAKEYAVGVLTIQRDIVSNGSSLVSDAVAANIAFYKSYVQSWTSGAPGLANINAPIAAYKAFTGRRQGVVADAVNKDVIQSIVPQIQDDNLKSQLIEAANNAIEALK